MRTVKDLLVHVIMGIFFYKIVHFGVYLKKNLYNKFYYNSYFYRYNLMAYLRGRVYEFQVSSPEFSEYSF